MHECDCTKLTGSCRHDCPICGGEGVLAKKRPTSKEVIKHVEKVMQEASRHLVFDPTNKLRLKP